MAPTKTKPNLAFLATLTAESATPTELAPTTRAREATADFGPWIAWLNDSYTRVKAGTKPSGMSLSIPADSATAVSSLCRRAAASIKGPDGKAKLGVAIQISEPNKDGNVTFSFKAKDPVVADPTKPRRPVRKDKWTDTEYLTATRKWIGPGEGSITDWLIANGEPAKVETATAKAVEDVKALRAKIAEAKAKAAAEPAPAAPAAPAPAAARKAS